MNCRWCKFPSLLESQLRELCTLSDLLVLLISTVSLISSQLTNHVVEEEQIKQWLAYNIM